MTPEVGSDVEAQDDSSPSLDMPSPRPRVRARYVVAVLVAFGAVAWLLVAGLSDSLVYLRPVSEAVERRDDQGTRTFRMGGTVVPGTIAETADGVTFAVTEGGATVRVVHHGDPPDLFEDGAPVVVEGMWRGDEFDSERLLIRHGNEYTPPTERSGS
jgi:cytochrome c-type biogenesis protein CcmE